MASSSSIEILNQKLSQVVRPLHIGVRLEILSSLWNLSSLKDEQQAKTHFYDSYFRHYEDACLQLPPDGISQLTHRQILDVVNLVVDQRKRVCRGEVKQLLPQEFEKSVEHIVVFAANALLLLDVSRWRDEQYLQHFIQSQFRGMPSESGKSRLPRTFNFKSMSEIAGIQPNWTPDIMQHLSVRHDDEGVAYVAVFHHVAVLDLYKNSKHDIFPDELLEEIRKTLSILLPQSNRRWFNKRQKKLHLDPKAGAGGHLRADERSLEKFSYFRDRLLIIKETFDEHEPRGIRQFWRDDRNNVQWWTFWIALMVFLFSIIQCIEGGLQVYKAYHPSPSS